MPPATRTLALTALAASLALVAAPALAHEMLHEVAHGKAIAVKTTSDDGEVLADAAYQVYAPAAPATPYQQGRTDRGGWLSFVPDAPGTWRVKVFDDTGHGLDVAVDVAAPGGAAPGEAPTAGLPAVAFVLRPLAGLLVIGAVFAVLYLAYRRRGRAR